MPVIYLLRIMEGGIASYLEYWRSDGGRILSSEPSMSEITISLRGQEIDPGMAEKMSAKREAFLRRKT